jgi:hypothetical protein
VIQYEIDLMKKSKEADALYESNNEESHNSQTGETQIVEEHSKQHQGEDEPMQFGGPGISI